MSNLLDFLKVGDREYLKQHTEDRELIEDMGGRFGFRVAWMVSDAWATVWVFEIVAYTDHKFDVPMFRNIGDKGDQEFVDTIEQADWYLDGFVKFDGCSQFDMGDQHLCGLQGYQKHIALLQYIYTRAFELMGREPDEVWETK